MPNRARTVFAALVAALAAVTLGGTAGGAAAMDEPAICPISAPTAAEPDEACYYPQVSVSASPSSVTAGGYSTISWSVSGAPPGGQCHKYADWSGSFGVDAGGNAGGAESVGPLSVVKRYEFTIHCPATPYGGTGTAYVDVSASAPAPPPPPPPPGPSPSPSPSPPAPPPELTYEGPEEMLDSGRYASFALSSLVCYWAHWRKSAGLPPFRRSLHLRGTWCIRSTRVTSWSFDVWAEVDPGCHSSGDPTQSREAGGAGDTFLVIRARADFICTIFVPPHNFYPFSRQLSLGVRFNNNGHSEVAR